jgi:hypothetical protein
VAYGAVAVLFIILGAGRFEENKSFGLWKPGAKNSRA